MKFRDFCKPLTKVNLRNEQEFALQARRLNLNRAIEVALISNRKDGRLNDRKLINTQPYQKAKA